MTTKEKKPLTRRQLEGRARAAETQKKRSEARKVLLARLVDATREKDPFKSLPEILRTYKREVLPPPPPPSRSKRWGDAAAAAEAALQDLVDIQQEFSDWKDNLGDNLAGSPVGQKLETICDIGLESALTSVQDAGSADVPQGWGKD